MTTSDDDIHVRPGRIRHGNQGAKRPKTFVGEVMRAAKKAGHVGNSFRSSRAARALDGSDAAAGRRSHLSPLERPARGDDGPYRSPPGHACSAPRRCPSTWRISSATA